MNNRIFNYVLLAVMAFATTGCIGDINTDIPSVESGDEVQFGLTLPGLTRTVYGSKSGSAYPIYWVNGDKVLVHSPQCLPGRNSAEYKVSVTSATQNYATSLTPTGATGVQWGDQDAYFYSVYPSGKYIISDDGNTINNLKINFSDDFEVIDGVVTPKQADCLMIAKTGKMSAGSPVNLTYSPIATALMFTLNGPTDDKNSNTTIQHTIQSIKLIAPKETYIAGDFNVQFSNEKYIFKEWATGGEKSNVITAQLYDQNTGAFYKISEGESVKMSLFLVPREDLKLDKNWKLEIRVQTYLKVQENGQTIEKLVEKTFTKSLGFKNSNGEAIINPLKPGMVHELPALPNLDITEGQVWEPGNWIEKIPRNVYLSEISLPGSWNSLNTDSQGSSPSIASQYALGVRAFHLDTRWKRSSSRPYTYELGIAIGGTGNTTNGDDKYMTAGPTFANALNEITQQIINSQTDEYIILICTFAQNSAQYNGEDGWIKAISSACALNDVVYDAKQLTPSTLVGDVLNKVIVIVNMEGTVTSVPSDSKCLFVDMPLTLSSDLFDSNNWMSENSGSIYKSAANSTSAVESDIKMYHTQAQITLQTINDIGEGNRDNGERGYIPTYDQRKTIADKILSWSKDNYGTEKYSHNYWIYLGLGGYYVKWNNGLWGLGAKWEASGGEATANINVANDFNTWINGKVTEMGTAENKPCYPVGIVLMNRVSSYGDVIKNILLLNNKYRLQYDPDKPTNYDPTMQVQSPAQSYSSGMNDSKASAFGWD